MQRRITSIGQGAPAIMPVRRQDRSNLAKSGWSSSAMNMVGTPCSAVQRSSATVSQRRERVEALAGEHHRGAVGHAGQIADHHAETMIERHRDAQPVVRA